MDSQTRFLKELKHYIDMQESLAAALCAQVNTPLNVESPSPLLLSSFPRSGQVILNTQTWDYTRHGAGVLFVEKSTGKKVDIHDKFDAPNYVDLWRLVWYFGSLRRTGVKLVGKALGEMELPLEEALDKLLTKLVESGELEQEGEHFRLPSEP